MTSCVKFLCPLHYKFTDTFGTILRHDNFIYIWNQGAFILEGYVPTTFDIRVVTLLGISFGGALLCVGGDLHGSWARGVPSGYKKVLNGSGQHIGNTHKSIELVDLDDWEIYLKIMERSVE